MTGRRPLAVLGAMGAFVAVALAPWPGLSGPGTFALATTAFAATLWVTEGLPLPATALCVPVLLTAFGVVPTMAEALAGFADPVIFLLLAGFVLARALGAHDVDRRIAYRLIGALGTSARRLVLAVMVATAGLSMVVSNSATTATMVPIALGVAGQVRSGGGPTGTDEEPPSNLEVSLLLGTAYAASIGGIGTLVGTPGNAIVVSGLRAGLGYEIGFLEWSLIGLPLVVVSLPLAWYLLAFRLFPPAVGDVSGARRDARVALASMGPLDAPARRTVAIAGATAGLWVLGGLDFLFVEVLPPAWHSTLFGGAGSVVGATHQGLLFYVLVGVAAIPTLLATGCLDWEQAVDIDWGTLLLLGGGLSLANGLAATDATAWLAEATFGSLVGMPVVLVLLVVVAVTVLFSELASNTAVVAVFTPLLVAIGPRYAAALGTSDGVAGAVLAVAAAVAASFGFALPVATPPNAIAFGTGALRREDMLRAGLRLDALLVVVATGGLLGLFTLFKPWL
jgi:sodium-dependent dicarboxylate transporter 2/3/5